MPKNFIKNVDFSGCCHLWTRYKTHNGYGRITIRGKKMRTHRLAWEYENGEIPEGMYVLHKCDNPACVNAEHLFLGSHQDNMEDMRRKGRGKQGGGFEGGENNPRTIINWGKVYEIRKMYQKGSKEFGSAGLSEKFGISKSQIKRIVNGERWREEGILHG